MGARTCNAASEEHDERENEREYRYYKQYVLRAPLVFSEPPSDDESGESLRSRPHRSCRIVLFSLEPDV